MDAVEESAVPLPARGEAMADDRFGAFAQRERKALVAFAWSLTGDWAAAEDLAQEALEATWQRWGRVGDYDRPGAWARRVVANRAVDRRRRAGREGRALGRWAGREPVDVEPAPADEEFWTALRTLSERQAQTLALRYLEDLPVADIAAVLGCAEGTVKVHLHRGRLTLALKLGLLDGGPR